MEHASVSHMNLTVHAGKGGRYSSVYEVSVKYTFKIDRNCGHYVHILCVSIGTDMLYLY